MGSNGIEVLIMGVFSGGCTLAFGLVISRTMRRVEVAAESLLASIPASRRATR